MKELIPQWDVSRYLAKDTILILLILFTLLISSCKKEIDDPVGTPNDPKEGTGSTPRDTFNIYNISDTYPGLYLFSNVKKWGPYNVHDPSIMYDGGYFYSYSTDVAYRQKLLRTGAQLRKSHNLIDWEFIGWAFNGTPSQAANYINQNGGTPFESVWAPYIMKSGNEYRLYYSSSSPTPKLSAIGLAVSSKPDGPWVERGLVVTSKKNIVMPNAIDPSVLVTPGGAHWMYYGSAWDGIYILGLDPETGLAKNAGDKGKRIAARGRTGNKVNGNIEGAEVIYHPGLNKYYLFIAYDWLATKYNVRVGRSDSPTGPFYDFNGNDLKEEEDNIPMIIAPYRFNGHGGWQGTSHCTVFQKDGQYFIAHQGRPSIDKYYMVMHVRRIFWTEDGWPVASPERYANMGQTPIPKEEITGDWEQIILNYRVVPGYANEQISPDLQSAIPLKIEEGGSINGVLQNSWIYVNNKLTLSWRNGFTDKLIVSRAWDWENKKPCIVFTGLNNKGTAIWGKK